MNNTRTHHYIHWVVCPWFEVRSSGQVLIRIPDLVFPRAACRIPHQELRMILGRPRILLFCVINIFSANSATKLLRQFLNLGTVAVQKQKRKKIINPLDRGAAAAFNFIILLFIRFSPTSSWSPFRKYTPSISNDDLEKQQQQQFQKYLANFVSLSQCAAFFLSRSDFNSNVFPSTQILKINVILSAK